MIYILLLIACAASVIMDKIQSGDNLKHWGYWFSKDAYTNKYRLAEWLNKFIPLWAAKFIAYNILVIGSDCFHFSKFIMILSLCLCISFSIYGVFIWLCWSACFNILYPIIK